MYKVLTFFSLLFLFLGCTNDEVASNSLFIHDETEWTYAIYMAADNNLERFALKNIKEIKESLDDKKINFIVLLDRANGYDKTEGNWTGTKILELNKNTELNDDVVLDLGEKNMTDASTLNDFLIFLTKYYPSKKIALNIWSHGFGVYPDCKIYNSRSLVQDYTTGYSDDDSFSIIDFSKILKTFKDTQNKKIDILQFDCCLMEMIEVLWQLKDCADFIIGSEAKLPGAGSNYKTLYQNFTVNTDAKECAYRIVNDFEEKYENTIVPCTYAVADMKNFDSFSKSFKNFLEELNDKDLDFSVINTKREELYKYDDSFYEYVDFKSFFYIFENQILTYSSLENMFFETLENYHDLILNSCATNAYSEVLSGFGINIPYTEKLYSYYNQNADDYLDIYKDTVLNKIIAKIIYSE